MSKYLYDPQRFAEIFKALSNPHRLKIFMRLAYSREEGAACNSDDQACECAGVLGKDLGIAQSTVSHHLKELHRSGLINMKRRGQSIECWVDPEVIDVLVDFLKSPVKV
jgi:ArsR family transcriptional regulator